ncbi:MAG: demethoxyubiquinone hydroxylase family protein [Alphaproteobacteria bacterium]|nr:demethoxyubiquinone hydroxylase family protein [Alphaproteobacteria bacterium]
MTEPTSKQAEKSGPRYLPGDPRPRPAVERMIRVDQAGEYGAARIYAGQLAVLGRSESAPVIRHMAEQEQRHLDTFNEILADRRVRPTVLTPIWHAAGYALGAGTALLGERGAMACTVAVEEVIDEHYAAQRDALGDDEADLRETIEEFRREEAEHRDIGLESGAEQAPAYPVLRQAIKSASRLAIWLSERV